MYVGPRQISPKGSVGEGAKGRGDVEVRQGLISIQKLGNHFHLLFREFHDTQAQRSFEID